MPTPQLRFAGAQRAVIPGWLPPSLSQQVHRNKKDDKGLGYLLFLQGERWAARRTAGFAACLPWPPPPPPLLLLLLLPAASRCFWCDRQEDTCAAAPCKHCLQMRLGMEQVGAEPPPACFALCCHALQAARVLRRPAPPS